MGTFLKKIAILCALLTVWSAMASVVHQHSNETEGAQCNLCIAAHSASPAVTAGSVSTTFVVECTVTAESVSVQPRFAVFDLVVRPPPSL